MNLILIRDDEWRPPGHARLTGLRARHLLDVLKVEVGRIVKVGRPGSLVGAGVVLAVSDDGAVDLAVTLDRPPPAKAGVDLILALPRPKVLARILEHATALGVGRIAVIRSWRVDKAYFESPILDPAALREHLFAGLEQAGDTAPPTVEIFDRFKPFVEDRANEWTGASRGIVLHPADATPLAAGDSLPGRPVVLAIGPEGGWLDYEVAAFERIGFERRALGARILKVETAVAFAIGRLR